ncbi:hypothetical protein acdb102_14230 [Acidothermaceae bacterium B102]|nr:hypothetical protein acdb102_14230 [Acidothermaceae bacterium B102]
MRLFARTRTVVAVVGLAAATLATPTLTAAADASASAKPGPVGGKVLLQAHTSLSGADAATDAAGNTYIGWIGDVATDGNADRTVYLCTIPAGGSACQGGVQSTPSLGIASAAGLRLLVTKAGLVTLIWSADAAVPAFTGRDVRIVTSTSQAGAALTPAAIVADAPSESSLYDAELAPDGSIWTVVAIGAGTNNLEVREGVTNPAIVVTTPYFPGSGYLAFAGSTPVIAIQKYGAISTAPEYTHGVGGGFAPWSPLGTTWTAAANIGLVATKTGVRIIDSVGNADYWPVVAKYSASSGKFGKAALTGDTNNCAPTTHDLNTDASGRLVDVNIECSSLAVASLPGTTVAGLFRMPVAGTFAGITPQIATTPRGHGVVVWAVEGAQSQDGDSLYFNRILLPGKDYSVNKSGVVVTGPTSCQPASTIAVSVKGAKAGWKVASASLTFGGKKLASKATINGASLQPGKVYALVGKVVFTKGGVTSSGTATLTFRSCINP